jgi:hypothetical protein
MSPAIPIIPRLHWLHPARLQAPAQAQAAPPSPIDVFADMPALICCGCNKIFSKGGHLWEAEYPSEECGMCVCSEVISLPKNPDDN